VDVKQRANGVRVAPLFLRRKSSFADRSTAVREPACSLQLPRRPRRRCLRRQAARRHPSARLPRRRRVTGSCRARCVPWVGLAAPRGAAAVRSQERVPLLKLPPRSARVSTREEERARIAALRVTEAGGAGGEPGEEGRQGLCCCQALERERLPLNHVDQAPVCDAAWSRALPRAAPGWREGGAVLPPAPGASAGVVCRRSVCLSRCWHSAARSQQPQSLRPLS